MYDFNKYIGVINDSRPIMLHLRLIFLTFLFFFCLSALFNAWEFHFFVFLAVLKYNFWLLFLDMWLCPSTPLGTSVPLTKSWLRPLQYVLWLTCSICLSATCWKIQPKSIGLVWGLAATRRSVYIHQMNWVNSHNDLVMMITPPLSWLLLVFLLLLLLYRWNLFYAHGPWTWVIWREHP